MGITGKLWLWFKDYLSNRKHYVQLGHVSSELLPVRSGVPQGSILGPLLFLIYINDMPTSISYSSCLLFADDAKILKTIRDLRDCDMLQNDLASLESWCDEWKL